MSEVEEKGIEAYVRYLKHMVRNTDQSLTEANVYELSRQTALMYGIDNRSQEVLERLEAEDGTGR